ncbi:MAG: hypothetical protein JWM04_1285 [Verrucomicrobiales bacterium]|nr:hypothetical protein [Verrucomicrobiales bacterium]
MDEGWNSSGIIITDKSTAFIRDGVTPRSEVVRNLGVAPYDFKLERTMAYPREIKKSHWGFQVFDESDSFANKTDRDLFCIRFNDNDQVTRHAIVRVKSPETPRDTVIRWIKAK